MIIVKEQSGEVEGIWDGGMSIERVDTSLNLQMQTQTSLGDSVEYLVAINPTEGAELLARLLTMKPVLMEYSEKFL